MPPPRTRPAFLAATAAVLLLAGGSASAQTSRYNHSMTLTTDGSVLIVGGMNSAGTPLSVVELYRSTDATYVTFPSLPVAR